jgi:hypothetical protein
MYTLDLSAPNPLAERSGLYCAAQIFGGFWDAKQPTLSAGWTRDYHLLSIGKHATHICKKLSIPIAFLSTECYT